jgi:hypothetical protein
MRHARYIAWNRARGRSIRSSSTSDGYRALTRSATLAQHKREIRAQRLQTRGPMDREQFTPELVRGSEPGEWCVMLGGQRVLTFSGPGAHDAAERHCAELDGLVGAVRHARESHDERID